MDADALQCQGGPDISCQCISAACSAHSSKAARVFDLLRAHKERLVVTAVAASSSSGCFWLGTSVDSSCARPCILCLAPAFRPLPDCTNFAWMRFPEPSCQSWSLARARQRPSTSIFKDSWPSAGKANALRTRTTKSSKQPGRERRFVERAPP